MPPDARPAAERTAQSAAETPIARLSFTQRDGAVEFQVKVVPGASRTRVCGVLGGALKISVSAPAEKGKANDAVVALLAAALSTKPTDVSIVAGQKRPVKTLRVEGVTPNDVAARLASAVAAASPQPR